MKTLREKIEVMQAALDGKKIEVKNGEREWRTFLYSDGETIDNNFIVWNWAENDYRIKPEPMEFWVNVYDDNLIEVARDKEKAEFLADGLSNHIRTIKVREVIE